MLSIGTFSRATHVSIRALRRYHEQGLLVPAEVDLDTGYRSYRREQILDAQLIRRLRGLDLPLAEVARVVQARDGQVTAAVLTDHRRALVQRRDDVARMLADLDRWREVGAALTVGTVYERVQRAEPVVCVRGRTTDDDYLGFFGAAFGRLQRHVAAADLQVTGPGGARFPARQWDPADVEVEAFLPVRRAVAGRGVDATRLPAGRLAVVLHAGGYDGIDDAHAELGGWAAERGMEPGGSLQELYLVSPAETPDPAAWRTEVGWLLDNDSHNDNDNDSDNDKVEEQTS